MSEHLAPALQLMKTRVASRKIATHSCIVPPSLGWQGLTRDPNGPRFAGTESESADSDRSESSIAGPVPSRSLSARRAFPPGAVADSETDEPDGRQRHRPPASGSGIPLQRIHHKQRPRLETNRSGPYRPERNDGRSGLRALFPQRPKPLPWELYRKSHNGTKFIIQSEDADATPTRPMRPQRRRSDSEVAAATRGDTDARPLAGAGGRGRPCRRRGQRTDCAPLARGMCVQSRSPPLPPPPSPPPRHTPPFPRCQSFNGKTEK